MVYIAYMTLARCVTLFSFVKREQTGVQRVGSGNFDSWLASTLCVQNHMLTFLTHPHPVKALAVRWTKRRFQQPASETRA